MSKKKTIKCPMLDWTECYTNCGWWLKEHECCAIARIGTAMADVDSLLETIHILADKDMSDQLILSFGALSRDKGKSVKWTPLDVDDEGEEE